MTEVIAVSCGVAQCQETLRTAMAIGAAGAIAAFQSPEQMAQRIKSDYAKWGAVIRDKGISNE